MLILNYFSTLYLSFDLQEKVGFRWSEFEGKKILGNGKVKLNLKIKQLPSKSVVPANVRKNKGNSLLYERRVDKRSSASIQHILKIRKIHRNSMKFLYIRHWT